MIWLKENWLGIVAVLLLILCIMVMAATAKAATPLPEKPVQCEVIPAPAPSPAQCSCEKTLRLKLSQTSYTLNIWKHVRDAANAIEFDIPVPCSFYEQVQVGDDLLEKKFRWGSLAVGGTFGNWNLEVTSKR